MYAVVWLVVEHVHNRRDGREHACMRRLMREWIVQANDRAALLHASIDERRELRQLLRFAVSREHRQFGIEPMQHGAGSKHVGERLFRSGSAWPPSPRRSA